jgi:hypothetical protein
MEPRIACRLGRGQAVQIVQAWTPWGDFHPRNKQSNAGQGEQHDQLRGTLLQNGGIIIGDSNGPLVIKADEPFSPSKR